MCVCNCGAGRPEGGLEAEWAALGEAADIIAAAPGDEVEGEILALQCELAQQARRPLLEI